ncbi:hypothetical protein [Helicobacter sp. 13S00477-4]|uniref:phage terminase large subunit family protein n=1 Tax=Helicobacter sp. 13S00477-4 TaxID=1905759 RepID=UPI000BA65D48|nr:hypothetical protein [Helicobacter sp. 13S00477-4]PAF51978.1 hypothetical protein BKH44_04780 [Helicobacter sp. 13S00477-4]
MEITQLAKLELATRELCRRSLKYFLLQKWLNYEQKRFNDNWHYDYIAKYLQSSLTSNLNRLMINLPPSYGKTELIARTFIPWALGNNPTHKFMYVTYSDELYIKISNQIREVMKSPWYKKIFGEVHFIQDNTKEWVLKSGGGLFSTTLKSPITGFHAHTILVDDPIKASDISSRAERRRVIDNFRESILSRLLEDEESKATIIIMMQRLSEEDLCGYLLNPKNFKGIEQSQWKVVSLKALNLTKEVYECEDFTYTREPGEALFPSRHSIDSLKQIELEMGADAFSTQYMQDPQVSEAGYFQAQYFKTINSFEVPNQNMYIFVDTAESLQTTADNRAIVVFGMSVEDEREQVIVYDCFFGIWDEEVMVDSIIEAMNLYPSASVFIEQAGGGITITRLLYKKIALVNARLRNENKPILINAINPYQASRKISKVEKIKALRPYYNTGQLKFIHSARGLDQIKSELLSFNPEKPHKKDDCIDALASGLVNEDVRGLIITTNEETKDDFIPYERSGWNV